MPFLAPLQAIKHHQKSVKNWLQEWVFKIYKWKLGRSRWIAYFENYLQKWFGDRYGEFLTRIFHKISPQDFPTTISCKISCKIFPQDFPKLDPDWLAPHHPIPNAKCPPITAFLKWAFSPPPFPARISLRISHKNFPQDFPARISHKIFPQQFPTTISRKIFPQDFPATISHKIFPQDFPKLDPDWLTPHQPIPNAKFPPITAFLKLAFSSSPFPTRISHKISCNNFPQDFPARFSRDGSWLVGSPSPYSKC